MTASVDILSTEPGSLDAERITGKPASLWRTTARRLLQRKSAIAGMAILGALILTRTKC
jgi:hypothetical protein